MAQQQAVGDVYLMGPHAPKLAQLYATYLSSPDAVGPDWKDFFNSLAEDARRVLDEAVEQQDATARATPCTDGYMPAPAGQRPSLPPAAHPAAINDPGVRAAPVDSIRALMLIRAYRVRGHLEAELDPLGLAEIEPHPELDPTTYGFTETDMDRPIFIDNVLGEET